MLMYRLAFLSKIRLWYLYSCLGSEYRIYTCRNPLVILKTIKCKIKDITNTNYRFKIVSNWPKFVVVIDNNTTTNRKIMSW